MAKNEVEQEAQAIKAVITALEPLTPEVRSLVFDYIQKRFALSGREGSPSIRIEKEKFYGGGTPTVKDIQTLKEEKDPNNSVEMAVLVAYYLAQSAPEQERKQTIGTSDIQRYFIQAHYPLPKSARKTLFDAKKAGYLDAGERGQYRLNPVGHNLIVHRLPGTSSRKGKRRTKHPGPHARRRKGRRTKRR